ncbi:MAG: prepilin-type N-terminal cleavage/methylation domain-containing protein [Gemmatimonadota bacterium]|nr:MAG: prepilin-type N-terminal cleavage/methylation domain-containing protein [Gemmatimonadota bacterium]
MRHALSQRACERGFGLVSVLVAMVLIAVAAVALSSSSAFMASLQTDASERATAAAIAIGYMEDVKMRRPTDLASEEPVRVNGTGAPDVGGAFVRSITVEREESVPDALRVTVAVDYPAGFGRTRTVELVTVIDRGGG